MTRQPLKVIRRQRFHYTQSGYPKVPYSTEHEAWEAVVAVNKKGRGRRVHAYVCKSCKKWHLGRIPSRHPHEMAALKAELGARAYANLWQENFGSESRRFRVLISRMGFFFREADRRTGHRPAGGDPRDDDPGDLLPALVDI